MLESPGPRVPNSKYPPPQLTLAMLAWILGNTLPGPPTGRQPVPSAYPELTSQKKAEGHGALGTAVPVPAGASGQG